MEIDQIVKAAKEKGFSESEIKQMLLNKGYSNAEIDGVLLQKKLRTKNRTTKEYSYIKKIGLLFSKPLHFFEEIDEKILWPSFILFLIVYFIVIILSYGINSLTRTFIPYSEYFNVFSIIGYGFYSSVLLIILFLLLIIGTFIYAGIIYLIAKSMGGESTYIESCNLIIYSIIPSLIISLIPIIGLFGFLYSLIILIFGISYIHNISKGKAVFIALFPLIIFIVLIILMGYL